MFFSQSDRSTRGIAAQTSLLITLCTQLATDDGTLIAGARSPQHRKVFENGIGAIGEIQNAVLLASSLVDPSQLDRGFASHRSIAQSVATTLAATPASELRDFIDEVGQKIKDLGDELSNLRVGITNRIRAQEDVVAAGAGALALLDPVAREIPSTAANAINLSANDSEQIHFKAQSDFFLIDS